MRFLIFVWITLAVAAAGSAWYAMQPLRRVVAWFAIAVIVLVRWGGSDVDRIRRMIRDFAAGLSLRGGHQDEERA